MSVPGGLSDQFLKFASDSAFAWAHGSAVTNPDQFLHKATQIPPLFDG
jgi:hypothetical protein